jgi:hypothetical protein
MKINKFRPFEMYVTNSPNKDHVFSNNFEFEKVEKSSHLQKVTSIHLYLNIEELIINKQNIRII